METNKDINKLGTNKKFSKLGAIGTILSVNTLKIALVSLFISIFILTFSFSIAAQSGLTLIANIILAIYVIFAGIISLLLAGVDIFLTCKNLKSPKFLASFIISVVSILSIIASILIVYIL